MSVWHMLSSSARLCLKRSLACLVEACKGLLLADTDGNEVCTTAAMSVAGWLQDYGLVAYTGHRFIWWGHLQVLLADVRFWPLAVDSVTLQCRVASA